jgi:nuclear pore complex protein Nup98-Nup96
MGLGYTSHKKTFLEARVLLIHGLVIGSAFGTSSTTPFGAAKPFGAANTSGSTLFGGSTATTGGTGFGGFGSNTANTTNTSSPFGASTTGGGLFGSTANKPAFGSAPATGGGLFGSTNTNTAFGQGNNQTTSLFGNAQGTALGPNVPESQGTGSTPFQPFIEKDGPSSSTSNHFQSISFMSPYQKYSFEVCISNFQNAELTASLTLHRN